MQKIIIELTGDDSLEALQELESKNLIRILKEPDLISFALPGNTIDKDDFKKWIDYAENSPTVSSHEARQRWASQKEKLQKLIR